MPSFLKFLLDDMCANFTMESMYNLVKARLSRGPCTIGDLTSEIAERDLTLDIVSAQILAKAAVEGLVQSGDIAIQGADIYPASSIHH